MTPTARTLAYCRKQGWLAQVVELTVPRTFIKRDLFGIIDIVAVVPRREFQGLRDEWFAERSHIIGIQACAGASHAARRTKALAEPRLAAWLEAGARFEIWSWAKQGARGKRKTWTLRREAIDAETRMKGAV